ncbi:pyridoxamine 5'-phosphate oxidase family protein [Hyunsoonleella rubra]|uniref:Pyridoxamine 5'-phosphate oxidase family protein n=1 Tax=Hyunsoonleella rubra TaxID=1737062 RepID=A0ABW5T5Y2_9FLAO
MKDLKKYEAIHLLNNNYIGYLSFIWENEPYVLPITYYYDEDKECILSYSTEGHKIQAMRVNNSVSINVVQLKTVNNWQSVLVHGKFEELNGAYAKQQLHKFASGVKKIIFKKENKYPDLISDFSSKAISGKLPIVYRITISRITGKRRDF